MNHNPPEKSKDQLIDQPTPQRTEKVVFFFGRGAMFEGGDFPGYSIRKPITRLSTGNLHVRRKVKSPCIFFIVVILMRVAARFAFSIALARFTVLA